MTENTPPLADAVAGIANPDTQRIAARMAQDIFTAIFRALAQPEGHDPRADDEMARRCTNWVQAGSDDAGRALRQALLITGLDQWGLAYSQAFGLTGIPALSALIGTLRQRLDPAEDARFQQYFSCIEQEETTAIDFKIDLRRNIHLALWHAMTACEDDAAAEAITRTLGSLLLALERQMPAVGWRLIADALASIQAALLAGDLGERGQRGTQQLFASLQHALPAERYRHILATSAQAVLAWQQAQRAGHA